MPFHIKCEPTLAPCAWIWFVWLLTEHNWRKSHVKCVRTFKYLLKSRRHGCGAEFEANERSKGVRWSFLISYSLETRSQTFPMCAHHLHIVLNFSFWSNFHSKNLGNFTFQIGMCVWFDKTSKMENSIISKSHGMCPCVTQILWIN